MVDDRTNKAVKTLNREKNRPRRTPAPSLLGEHRPHFDDNEVG
jgi:hypothetical protein